MSSNSQMMPEHLSGSSFQGSYTPITRRTVEEVTTEIVEELIDILNNLSSQWEEYRRPSIRDVLAMQEELGVRFEVGLGWKSQRDAFRTQFTGTVEQFKEHLHQDKTVHVAVAEVCAAEAMVTICHSLIDALEQRCAQIEDGTMDGIEMMDVPLLDFARLGYSEEDCGLVFINNTVIPWIQSHGQDALDTPSLDSVENIRVGFWELFKSDTDTGDHCTGPDHRLGTRLWDCPVCVLDVTLRKLGIARPCQGRLAKRHVSTRSTSTSSDDPEIMLSQPVTQSPMHQKSADPVSTDDSVPINTHPPNNSSAVTNNPTSGVVGSISSTVSIVPAPSTSSVGTSATAVFKPVYTQVRANGDNRLVTTQASLAVSDILARSASFTRDQKEGRLSVGGLRYLCCYGPANNKCTAYFTCRGDLAKHSRLQHGVAGVSNAEWGQMGPFNIDELRILRPSKTFALKSAQDPAHMM